MTIQLCLCNLAYDVMFIFLITSQEKNKEKRKKRRGPRSVVSFGSDLDFKSVAETEFDSSSEEYFDFSTDAGDDDDDITITEDVPQNGQIKKKKDPLAKVNFFHFKFYVLNF